MSVCLCAGICLCECMNCAWQILHYRPGWFHLHADIVWFNLASVKDLRKALRYCFCFALPYPTRFRWSHQREMNLNCLEEEERRGNEIKGKGKPAENCDIRQGVQLLHADISPKTKKSFCLSPLCGSKKEVAWEEKSRTKRIWGKLT